MIGLLLCIMIVALIVFLWIRLISLINRDKTESLRRMLKLMYVMAFLIFVLLCIFAPSFFV